jgi:putative membrane protein
VVALIRAVALFLLAYTLHQLMQDNTLYLYINPRFAPFTNISLVAIVLLFGLALLDVFRQILRQQFRWREYSQAPFLVLLVALSPLIFTPQALGSSMINQKGLWTFGGAKSVVQPFKQQQPERFKGSIAQQLPGEAAQTGQQQELLELTDKNFIVKFAQIQRHPQNYAGKEIELEGFLVHHPLMDQDKTMIARYAIICCAADAQVIGFGMTEKAPFPEDTWVKVRGQLIQEGEMVVLKVQHMDKSPVPANPYLYAPEGLPEI